MIEKQETLQVLAYKACVDMPKTLEICKKSMPCFIQKASRCVADRTSKTTMLFIFYFLYNTNILVENHVYIFFISLVQW